MHAVAEEYFINYEDLRRLVASLGRRLGAAEQGSRGPGASPGGEAEAEAGEGGRDPQIPEAPAHLAHRG